MKKTIFDEIGGFDEKQNYAEDGNYFLKIAAKYDLYYSPIQMELYGGGKRGFGVSGLSGNLREMHLGNMKNIKEMYESGYISKIQYKFFVIFYWVKYLRRISITLMSRSKKQV